MVNKYKTTKFLHMDHIVDYKKRAWYVKNPELIKKHRFLPFIRMIKTIYKTIRKNDELILKIKIRELTKTAHLDGYIYRYYGDKINILYNDYLKKHAIDNCVIAYRDKNDHKCNIDFAAEVIKFIMDAKSCFIFIGDISDFFGSLSHEYILKMLKKLISVEWLDDDLYHVVNSLFNYYYIDEKELDDYFKGKYKTQRDVDSYFSSMIELREYIATGNKIHRFSDCYLPDNVDINNEKDIVINKKKFRRNHGIPQGTAISAVLANVYMIEFDNQINSLVSQYNGLYRRYSDDFVIVLPISTSFVYHNIFSEIIRKELNNIDLQIQPEKLRILQYDSLQVKSCNDDKKSLFDYLGFVFDGNDVFVRNRSVYKFYRKAYKTISYAKYKAYNNHKYKKGHGLPLQQTIYKLYINEYKDKKDKYGNFIQYLKKADKIFKEYGITTNFLNQISRRKKIRRELCKANKEAKKWYR